MGACPPALAEAERLAQPFGCLAHVRVDELRDDGARRHRAVRKHVEADATVTGDTMRTLLVALALALAVGPTAAAKLRLRLVVGDTTPAVGQPVSVVLAA